MIMCTTCGISNCTCGTDGTNCPVGYVGVFDETGAFAGCLTPQDAKIYNDDKNQCATGYVKLVDPHTTEFLGCVVSADLSGLLTSLESATLHVGLTYSNITCFGETDGVASANVSGGTAPYTIVWETYDNTPANPFGLSAGSYKVTVTDNAGVSQVKGFSISEPLEVNGTTATQDETSLGAGDGRAIVYPAGGVAPYTFLWKDGGGFDIGQITAEVTGLSPDTYTCEITDSNGCVSNPINAVVA